MNTRKLTIGLFCLYLLGLTWIILFKMQFSVENLNHERNINLIPFAASAMANGRVSLSEIINNLLAFVPYGVFVCMLMENKRVIVRIMPVFITSLAYEIMQFVFALGSADITDLIGNTAGGMIGIGVFFVFSKIFKERSAKILNILFLIAAIMMVVLIGLLLIANRYQFGN